MAQGLPYGHPLTSAIDSMEYRLSIDLLNQVEQAIRGGTRGYLNSLIPFAEAIQKGISNPADRLRINQSIADLATDKVVAAYLQRINQGNVYRTDSRYAGGVLLRALQTPGVVAEATANGLHLYNQSALDKAARQWRRLNYGAGSAGTSFNERIPLMFGPTGQTVQIGSISENVGPRPGFLMPRGFFTAGRPSAFYPQSKVLTQPTKGIKSAHFMEEAFKVVGATFGPGYSQYVNRAIKEGESALGQAMRSAQRPISHNFGR